MSKPDFPRQIHNGDAGDDVYGHKRAMHRYLQTGDLDELEAKPIAVKRQAGDGFEALTKRAQHKARQPESGVYDERLYNELWRVRAYDAKAENLVRKYNMQHPQLKICFPLPSNIICSVGGLHETAGIPGNWAKDWICAPGAPVLAVEKGTIIRLSGNPPSDDSMDAQGVYGWSVSFVSPAGYRYFVTHLGRREPLRVGQIVDVGEPLGFVGDQHYRPDHVHYGVTSPLGEADARRRISAVANAPRVTL